MADDQAHAPGNAAVLRGGETTKMCKISVNYRSGAFEMRNAILVERLDTTFGQPLG